MDANENACERQCSSEKVLHNQSSFSIKHEGNSALKRANENTVSQHLRPLKKSRKFPMG
jgi:hypothetical protein